MLPQPMGLRDGYRQHQRARAEPNIRGTCPATGEGSIHLDSFWAGRNEMQRRFPVHTSFMTLPVRSLPHDSSNPCLSQDVMNNAATAARGFGAATAVPDSACSASTTRGEGFDPISCPMRRFSFSSALRDVRRGCVPVRFIAKHNAGARREGLVE